MGSGIAFVAAKSGLNVRVLDLSVEKAEAALGTIDILVNNAGIPDAQRAHKMSNDFVDQVFSTNLIGPWKLSCEVARRLIAAEKPGRMINIPLHGVSEHLVETIGR